MAKPSDIYAWATNPGATADPGSTRKATGFVAGKKAPSKWFNWLHDGAARWHAYLRDLHVEPEFLGEDYTWEGEHVHKDTLAVEDAEGNQVSLAPDFGLALGLGKKIAIGQRTITRLMPLGFLYANPVSGGSPVAVLGDQGWAVSGAAQVLAGDLDLPVGSQLLSVRAGVKGTSAGSTPIAMTIKRIACDTVSPTATNVVASTMTDTATAGAYDVLAAALSGTVDATYSYRLTFAIGTDATLVDPDQILWVEIRYSTTHVDPND